MTDSTHAFVAEFEPAPRTTLCVGQHYLLYARRGVLRLEADGTSWTLPPARAALIEAGKPIEVTIVQPVQSASVLFSPSFARRPPVALTVFDMSPLAQTLVAECCRWTEGVPIDDYAVAMFRALAEATWALAEHPSSAAMPTGRSPEVRRALEICADHLGAELRFGDVAAAVGLSPRSLARRFDVELAMTWRAAMRRLRVLRSIELLAGTDLPITRIAMDVGYSSLSAFESAFRDLIGTTPSAYRAEFPAPGRSADR